jgi:putative hydrolase of the HAD superfamily
LGLSLNVCEVDERWEKIKEKTLNYWLPYDGIYQTLEELKKHSIGMGIISNWDDSAQAILKNAKLHKYFEHQVISSEIGCTKPSAEIFKAAIDKAGVNARECLYVGDNYYDDAIGCRKVGMNALIINRFGSLGIEEIKDCPVILHIGEVLGYCKKTKKRKIVRGRKNS